MDDSGKNPIQRPPVERKREIQLPVDNAISLMIRLEVKFSSLQSLPFLPVPSLLGTYLSIECCNSPKEHAAPLFCLTIQLAQLQVSPNKLRVVSLLTDYFNYSYIIQKNSKVRKCPHTIDAASTGTIPEKSIIQRNISMKSTLWFGSVWRNNAPSSLCFKSQ